MEITFNEFVNYIKELSIEEKEEIKFIIERELIELRRDEIYQNYLISKNEFQEGKLIFSNGINTLKTMINEK